jgi:glycosyltransferase involved in cell wall biosynthesis
MHDVLIVGNHLSATGASRAVGEDLAIQLRARGVPVFTASQVPNKALRLYDMLHTTWSKRKQYDVAVLDVFSGQAFRFAEAVSALLRRLRKPHVLVLHGGDLPRFAARYPRRVARVMKGATVVTSPSSYLSEAFRSLRPDIIEIPNPIDCSKYSYRHRVAPRPNLMWLRTFARTYNPAMAPRVLKHLLSEHPESRLTMVGKDNGDGTLAETQAEIKRLGLADKCSILPKVAKHEVPETLSACDIFLNTSNVDNTPVTVLEAMACGLCVVSTNVGGMPHLATDREQALLVRPNDDMAMAGAVQEILQSPALAASLSANGRQKAETCDWPQVLDQWMQLFDRVHAQRSR